MISFTCPGFAFSQTNVSQYMANSGAWSFMSRILMKTGMWLLCFELSAMRTCVRFQSHLQRSSDITLPICNLATDRFCGFQYLIGMLVDYLRFLTWPRWTACTKEENMIENKVLFLRENFLKLIIFMRLGYISVLQ